MSNLYPKIGSANYSAPPPYNPESDTPSAPPPAEKPKRKLIGFGAKIVNSEAKVDDSVKPRGSLSYGYGTKVVKVPEKGHLQVKICEAHLDQYMRMHVLDDEGVNSRILQSPFVRIKCGDTALATWSTTKAMKNQLSPTWDETFLWKIERLTGTVLVLEVHDSDSRTMMAATKIDLSSVLTGGLSTRKTYPLTPKGDIELEIKYQSKGFDMKSIHDNVYEDMDILGVKVSKYDDKCFQKPPLESMNITPGPSSLGAIVAGVKDEAKEMNIKVGMKLVEINTKDVKSMAFWEIAQALTNAKEFPVVVKFE